MSCKSCGYVHVREFEKGDKYNIPHAGKDYLCTYYPEWTQVGCEYIDWEVAGNRVNHYCSKFSPKVM
jgi:hypothetical protein